MFKYALPKKDTTIAINSVWTIREGLRGVYVLRNEFGDIIYVGQSKTLRQRLNSHIAKSPFSAHIAYADLYYIDDGFEREICETIFINQMRPRYNKAKVFEDYNDEMAKLLSEIEELEDDRILLREERDEIRQWLRRDSEVTDEMYDYYTDEDECDMAILGEDFRSVERLAELSLEIERASIEIRSKYKLLK